MATDTWSSIDPEIEKNGRLETFVGDTADPALMRIANKDALFMHCFPSCHRVRIATEVIDGPQNAI